MVTYIDRRGLKAEMKSLLADAQVPPKAMLALYMGLLLLLDLVNAFTPAAGLLSTFVSIFTSLLGTVLGAGFVLYCMAVRRGERAEFLTLFDGFSFVGKLIALSVVMYLFIFLWSLLFVIPGVIAGYRYRFAYYNLYENPGIGVMEALDMSKRQTFGYKQQLFSLDLTYIGWALLASLPSLAYSFSSDLQIFSSFGLDVSATAPAQLLGAGYLPAWAWVLVADLWSLAVCLFYFAVYQCVDLGYFEIAKKTSGIPRSVPPWQSGPDDMGPF